MIIPNDRAFEPRQLIISIPNEIRYTLPSGVWRIVPRGQGGIVQNLTTGAKDYTTSKQVYSAWVAKLEAEQTAQIEAALRAITDAAIDCEPENVQTCEDCLDAQTLNAVEFTAWNDTPATSARYPLNIFDMLAVVAAGAAAFIIGGK